MVTSMKHLKYSLLSVLSALLLSIPVSSAAADKSPDVLNVSMMLPLSDFHYFQKMTADIAIMVEALHEGLLSQDHAGEVKPSLTKSWTHSKGGKHHRFVLRKNARWSNGKAITAGDFARGIYKILDPQTKHTMRKAWQPLVGWQAYQNNPNAPSVLGVNVLDSQTLELEFINPIPYISHMLMSPNLVPIPKAAEQEGYWKDASRQLFSGRFTLNQPLEETPLVMTANPHYGGTQGSNFKKINVYQHAKGTAKENAGLFQRLIDDELDVIMQLPNQLLALNKQHKDLFTTRDFQRSVYLVFNTQKAPFQKAETRQLFAKVINIHQFSKGQKRSSSSEDNGTYFIPKTLGGILQHEYPREVAINSRRELKQHLTTLGYSPDSKLDLTLLKRSRTGGVAEYICLQLANDLINCNVKYVKEYKTYLKEREKRDYHFITTGWQLDIPHPINLLQVFSSDHASNHALWQNPEYDQLLSKIQVEPDIEKSMALSRQAEHFFLEQAVVISMQPSTFTVDASSKHIKKTSSTFSTGKGLRNLPLIEKEILK